MAENVFVETTRLPKSSNSYVSAKDFEDSDSIDVTEIFISLTNELPMGKLLLSPGFALIDAMSAVELMDPKMDLGMKPIDQTLGLKYAIENGRLIEFSTEEMIAIFDASFACIASSLDGAFFDQAIYTNICVHNPEIIEDEKLRIISKGFLLLTKTIRYLIDLAGVAYEEDYNHQCLRDQGSLKSNNTVIINELKSIYQKISKSQHGSPSHSLAQRIKLFYEIFEALHYMVASPEVVAVDSTLSFEVDFKQSQQHMEQALKAFEIVKATISQGVQPPDGSSDENYAWLSVFQPDVNRHLFGASFPKEAKLMNRKDGYEYLEKTLNFLLRFTIELPEKVKYIESLMGYVREISNHGADVFARSTLCLMIFPFNDNIFGKLPITEIIINSMKVTVAPFILNKEYAFSDNVHYEWQTFLKSIAAFFIDLLQAYGMNHARQRERIGNFMEGATSVYSKAEAIDKFIAEYLYSNPCYIECVHKKPYPISTFFANHFMELMSYYIDLGFKLDLHVDHELPYVYWYLGEVISLWRHRFWMKAKDYIEMEKTFKPPDMLQKKFDRKKMQREGVINRHLEEIEKKLLQIRLQASFCEVYFCISAGRVCSGNLTIPDNEQMRYSSRFEAFRHVPTFASCPYVRYIVESQFPKFTQLTAAECFKKASQGARLCVEILQHLRSNNVELQNELDLAKRNMIACSLLSSKPEMFDSLDFKKNYLLPLIVVKKKPSS